MNYSTSKLQSVIECDQAIALATERKTELIFDQTVQGHTLGSQEKSAELANANLISTNAQIVGAEAAIAVTADGPLKNVLIGKLRRLNDRKENLTERMQKGGNIALLDTELDATLIASQLVEIDTYIAVINTRKSSL